MTSSELSSRIAFKPSPPDIQMPRQRIPEPPTCPCFVTTIPAEGKLEDHLDLSEKAASILAPPPFVSSITGPSAPAVEEEHDDHDDDHEHDEVSTTGPAPRTSSVSGPTVEWQGALPELELHVEPNPEGGWNISTHVTNFSFSPDHVSDKHVPGAGHVHIYVDGRLAALTDSPTYHLPSLTRGAHVITATLSGNNHSIYTADGKPIRMDVPISVS
jgi:hypothetical protein